jgi:hypothetical protein
MRHDLVISWILRSSNEQSKRDPVPSAVLYGMQRCLGGPLLIVAIYIFGIRRLRKKYQRVSVLNQQI